MNFTMGIDQDGTHYDDLGEHPRATLLDRLNSTSAAKMYVDKKNGPPVHIGYIIRGRWITLYNVTPWERPAGL